MACKAAGHRAALPVIRYFRAVLLAGIRNMTMAKRFNDQLNINRIDPGAFGYYLVNWVVIFQRLFGGQLFGYHIFGSRSFEHDWVAGFGPHLSPWFLLVSVVWRLFTHKIKQAE